MRITLIPIKPPKGGLLNRAKLMDGLTRAVRDMQAEGVRFMAEYPAAVGRYKRTGTLKRSWSAKPVRRTSTRIEGEIGSNGNIAPYNGQVQGDAQEAFFRGRGWRSTKDLEALIRRQLPQRAQAEINRAAAGR